MAVFEVEPFQLRGAVGPDALRLGGRIGLE